MHNHLKLQLNSIENLIKTGMGAQARAELLALASTALPREWTVRFASLCRRANEPLAAIRALRPYVRPKARKAVVATTEEWAEYAANLTRIGASLEAQHILKSLPQTYAPALLYQAFALASQWDYAEMIPILQRYLAHKVPSDYERLVGTVNLVSALIYEGSYTEAETYLKLILNETRRAKLWLLYGNALELSAANLVYQGNSRHAQEHLDHAERLLADVPTVETVFVGKWRAFARLQLQNADEDSLRQLQIVRMTAMTREHWETVRDCDRFEALLSRNPRLLTHLYFGTPFASYRQKLLRDSCDFFQLPEFYDWAISPGKGKCIDLLHGTGGRGRSLKIGQSVFRTAEALYRDFYRPQRLAALYAVIFPNDYFNPDTSFKRVHFAILRLRRWFKRNRIPLHIVERAGAYRYEAIPPLSLRLWNRKQVDPKLHLILASLRSADSITRQRVEDLFRCSPKTANRILRELVQTQQLVKQSKGNRTYYMASK